MFKKLDLILPKINIHELKGELEFEHGNFAEFSIIDSINVFKIFENTVQFLLPPDKVNVTTQSGFTTLVSTGATRPHNDSWNTALNCYFYAEDEITTFYDNPDGHKIKINEEDKSGAFFYNPKKLTPIGSFQAKTNESYLLDTRIPHNVSRKFLKDNNRAILRFIWNKTPYDVVLDSIKII